MTKNLKKFKIKAQKNHLTYFLDSWISLEKFLIAL